MPKKIYIKKEKKDIAVQQPKPKKKVIKIIRKKKDIAEQQPKPKKVIKIIKKKKAPEPKPKKVIKINKKKKPPAKKEKEETKETNDIKYLKDTYSKFPSLEKEVIEVLKKNIKKTQRQKELKIILNKYAKIGLDLQKKYKVDKFKNSFNSTLMKKLVNAYTEPDFLTVRLEGEEYTFNPQKKIIKPIEKETENTNKNFIIDNWNKDVNNVELEQKNEKLTKILKSLINSKKQFINLDNVISFDLNLTKKLMDKYPFQKVLDGYENFVIYLDSGGEKKIGQDKVKDYFMKRDNRIISDAMIKKLPQKYQNIILKEWKKEK